MNTTNKQQTTTFGLLELLSAANKYREADSVPQNIQIRKNRGSVAINQIMMKLAELCLGKWYYEAAMIFRNSLLLSTLLTN